jgi:hypothetical protein
MNYRGLRARRCESVVLESVPVSFNHTWFGPVV